MMEKRCELCGDRATLYCSADDANVCWSCDAKVHSANFLVARHARSVLCSNCCRETECKTSGANPSPLSRLCSGCNPSTVERIVENDCNGDSEEKESSETHSYPSATTEVQESGCTCASQESHTGSRARALERRKAAVEMLGRPRATSRGFHGADSKRLLSGLERGKKVQGRRSKRRSSSPTGVVDILALKLANHNHRAAEGGQQPADGGSRVGSNSPTGCVHTTSNLPLPVEEAADDSSCLSMVYNESCEL